MPLGLSSASPAPLGQQRRPHDAGVVGERRRHHRRAAVQRVEPLPGLARDPAAQHEQLGPQQLLDVAQVGAHALPRPRLVVQAVPLAGAGRGVVLDVGVAVQLQVAQLGVGHQAALAEDGGADAGAERQQHHDAGHVGRRPVADLREAGGVGVVHGAHRHPEPVGDRRGDVGPQPRVVDVGREHGAPADDRRGEGAADPPGPPVLGHHARDRVRHGVGRRRLRRVDAHALVVELPGPQVHRCALDAAAADVDAVAEPVAVGGGRGLGARHGVSCGGGRARDDGGGGRAAAR